jgi:hypothetical protein
VESIETTGDRIIDRSICRIIGRIIDRSICRIIGRAGDLRR